MRSDQRYLTGWIGILTSKKIIAAEFILTEALKHVTTTHRPAITLDSDGK